MKWWGWGDEAVEFDISNRPELWPYISSSLKLKSDKPIEHPVPLESIVMPAQHWNARFVEELRGVIPAGRIEDSKLTRLTHAYGKSLRDLWRVRRGEIGYAPDLVVFPETHEEVVAIVQGAVRHGVVVVPFGGGSNIVGCLEPSRREDRMVVCVDMRRMERMLHLDERSETARFQAGVLGPRLEEQLHSRGFTLGHFPDSFLFSTLGGWVATRSAGMQSDRYGKIEDMVVALRMVTPSGTIETLSVPKASSGIDINYLCIGSEGTLGIITEVMLNVHRAPERKESRGYLFPDFASGVEALQACHREDCVPVMARLNDPKKTALSFAYKSAQSPLKRQLSRGIKTYLRTVRRMQLDRCCLLLAGFEGSPESCERERNRAESIYRRFGAFALGGEPGRAFQAGKYDFPYLRDFMMDRGVLADVSETATTWSNLMPLYEASTKSIQSAMDNESSGSWVGCHVSHTYHAGASLYFTFGFVPQPGNEFVRYLRVKRAAEDSFLSHGATLSHHHAVGIEHLPWLVSEISPAGIKAVESLKNGLDPHNLLNPGKLRGEYTFSDWGLPEDLQKP